MANALRDQNRIPTLLGVSSADGVTPVIVYANPTTHRLLVDATSGITGPVSSTDNAVVRFNGTTGQTVQDSGVLLDDSGNFSGTTNIPFITSGAGAPGTTPDKIGDMYINTSNAKVYIATGTSSSNDWTILN